MIFILTQTEDQSDKEFIFMIYDKYHRLMFATAINQIRIMRGNEESAADIVQESLIKLINHVETMRKMDENARAAYVVKAVKNTAINFIKKENSLSMRSKSLDDEIYEIADSNPSLFEIMDKREMAAQLAEVLNSLTWKEKILLEGKYFLGYNDKEIGEMIGCKTDSVRMKLTRVRKKVLAKLTDKNREGLPE